MKRILSLLAVAFLLSGCTLSAAPTGPSTSSFPIHKTPAQMLSEAVEKTANASSFTLQYSLRGEDGVDAEQLFVELIRDGKGGYYALSVTPCGCGVYVSGNTAVKRDCDSAEAVRSSADSPYDLAYIMQQLPQLATTQGLLDRFAALGPTASPSNTGITRFSVQNLDLAQMCDLLGRSVPVTEQTAFSGSFDMELDSAGYLICVEFSEPQQAGVRHRFTVTRINEKISVKRPQWAQ